MFAHTGRLLLPPAPLMSPSPHPNQTAVGPRDDYELIVDRFGPPDADDSTDHDVPRPPNASRWITYKGEHVRFVRILDAKLGGPPPDRWKPVGPSDPRRAADPS
jgi:hypothetical protein